MTHRFAWLTRCLTFLSFFLAGSAGAAGWNYGLYQSLWHNECQTGNTEVLAQTQAGYFGDSATPKVGEVYYVSALVAVIGNSCVGGAQVIPEVQLPPQTVLAISSQYPVRCVYTDIKSGTQTELSAAECPQTASVGLYGQYAFVQPAQSTFPVPYGKRFEIWVPVLSKTTLSGISTNFTAVLRIASGVSGDLFPKVGVFVYPNPPTITYPVPSTTSLGSNAASTRGVLNNHYTYGNVYADFGKTTSYELSGHGPFAIGDYDMYQVNLDWTSLTPGTLYHWRLRFVSSTGATTLGADQTFTTTGTPPAGQYQLAMSVTSGGSVDISPNLPSYPAGTQVTFTARPEPGFRLGGWKIDGVAAGSANPLVHTITKEHFIGVTFQQLPPGGDAGTGASDAGTGASDAGTGASDAGTGASDAGTGVADGGTNPGPGGGTGSTNPEGGGCSAAAFGPGAIIALVGLLRRRRGRGGRGQN
jgi:List-Bact-rpt repeat protein